jgi:hypothetical protein
LSVQPLQQSLEFVSLTQRREIFVAARVPGIGPAVLDGAFQRLDRFVGPVQASQRARSVVPQVSGPRMDFDQCAQRFDRFGVLLVVQQLDGLLVQFPLLVRPNLKIGDRRTQRQPGVEVDAQVHVLGLLGQYQCEQVSQSIDGGRLRQLFGQLSIAHIGADTDCIGDVRRVDQIIDLGRHAAGFERLERGPQNPLAEDRHIHRFEIRQIAQRQVDQVPRGNSSRFNKRIGHRQRGETVRIHHNRHILRPAPGQQQWSPPARQQ